MQFTLKGELAAETDSVAVTTTDEFTSWQRKTIFFLGVGGLMFVPVFKSLTQLPPYLGIMLVLGILWTVTEIFYAHLKHPEQGDSMQKRVSNLLSRIDISTILFFLGILMAVSCLEEVGVLTALGSWLNTASGGNHYLVTAS